MSSALSFYRSPLTDFTFHCRQTFKTGRAFVDEDGQTVSSVRLIDDILAWRSRLSESFGDLKDVLDNLQTQETSEIWDERLCLPSDFTEVERRRYGLRKLATLELTLREGEAHDILQSLRRAVRDLTQYTHEANKYTRRIDVNTRFGHAAQAARSSKAFWISEYHRVRRLMLKLGMPEKHNVFRELVEKDTYRPSTDTPMAFNTGKTEVGWIWTVSSGFSASDNGPLNKREKEGE